MPPKTQPTDFDDLKKDITAILSSESANPELVVSLAEQEKEIQLLKETIPHERFFFVVNLVDFELDQVHGIQRYLGHAESDFTYKKYWNSLIHPGKLLLKLLARHMYETLCSGQYPLKFMVQRFTSLVPLRHYDGHYILTKKTSSVFQYDRSNRLLSYVDEFTIIGDYNGEPLSPRMWFDYDSKESDEKKRIINKTIEGFVKMKVFSVTELQIARKLAYNQGKTQAQIAKELGLSTNTINTFYKRFLAKAREFFKIEFPTFLDATNYLKREGLL